ncbi:MAG: radical SAM protein, partial [Dehalococcoidales bacterium]|nr:radical SAM protein [Dehalococcoidales bacterium]
DNVKKKAAFKFLNHMLFLLYDSVEIRKQAEEKYGFLPPTVIVISPTMRCNLHCYGCYAGEYSKKDDLPFDIFKRVVEEARDMGTNFVTISGGEPFISEDVLKIWETHRDMFFVVYTNGTLIDASMAKWLSRLGNVFPCISVEGYEQETEDRRGKGTYAKILAAMDNLLREGVLFGFSATATRQNNELISSEEFIDFYIEKGCFFGWYFNYIPIGRKPALELMPTPQQRIERLKRINRLRQEKPILLADFWCDGPLAGGCIAGGRGYLHINNNGDAEPCVFAHFAVDNVMEKSLLEILTSPLFRAIRSRQPYSQNLLRPCMIIDEPSVLREVVAEEAAHPTHPGAETIITELAPAIDRYADEYAGVADPLWAEQYQAAEVKPLRV